MAIVFITGSAGAGKSYYAVKRIVENLKKDTNLVVSNIDGLDRVKLSFYLGKEVNNLWTLDEFLATALSFCNLPYDGNYRNALRSYSRGPYPFLRYPAPYFFFEIFRVSRAGAGRQPVCLWACITYHLILNLTTGYNLRIKISP